MDLENVVIGDYTLNLLPFVKVLYNFVAKILKNFLPEELQDIFAE